MDDPYEDLAFPARAELLQSYKNYRVEITHWSLLAEQFRKTYRQVYTNKNSAVLLVHGPQGSGKSMFCARLEQDHRRTRDAGFKPDLKSNLWHVLVATDEPSEEDIKTATQSTQVQLVDDTKERWLDDLRAFAKSDNARVRLILCDDANKRSMTQPWTGLSAKDFYDANHVGPDGLLETVAEKLNDACRREFQRTIFVMLSNDDAWLEKLRTNLERWYRGLALKLALPVPAPSSLERIVRINTNRLNRMSYGYCLDAAKPEQRRAVLRVLKEGSGFTDSFEEVRRSLDNEKRREGRPGNPNVITLVTLGSELAAVERFLDAREIKSDAYHGQSSAHLGVWDIRRPWASKMMRKPDEEFLRRAEMLESEFMLRWVSLDMTATHALLAQPVKGDIGERLMQLILLRPSIGVTGETKTTWRAECAALDAALNAPPFAASDVEQLTKNFQDLGQRRSTVYERDIVRRLNRADARYGRGFSAYPTLKPDLIVDEEAPNGEYKACALTDAKSDIPEDISGALRRTGHSIEFTAYIREDLEGLEAYLNDKITCYAAMLEAV
jgi:hypothetical protein